MNTTLNKIRAHDPCCSSWTRLLESLGKKAADDEPLPMEYILDTLGLDDCLWAARSLPEYSAVWRLFAADCAEQVLPIFERKRPADNRPRLAIQAARRHAAGEIADDELVAAKVAAKVAAWAAAGDAAWDAAWAAAWAAAGAAAWDAAWDAAGDAAWAAARAAAGDAAGDAAGAAREWQAARLRRYLNGTITDNAASDGGEGEKP